MNDLSDYESDIEKALSKFIKEYEANDNTTYHLELLKDLKSKIISYGVTIRQLDNNLDTYKIYLQKKKEYFNKYNAYNDNVNLRNDYKRGLRKNLDDMNPDEISEIGKKLQLKDIAIAESLVHKTQEIINIGDASAQRLAQNTETLKTTIDEAQYMNDLLDVSQKQMSAYARKVATDKLIMSMMLVMVILIIAIIIIKMFKLNIK